MKKLVCVLGFSTVLFAACQQPSSDLAPVTPDAARAEATPTKCSSPLSVKIKSSYKDYDRLYLFEAMYVGRNGKDSTLAASVYQDLINGDEVTFADLAYNKPVRVRFYENEQDKTKFISSGIFSSCGQGGADFDFKSFKPAVTASPVTFQVKFPCTDVDNKKLPATVAVEFRQTGTSQWLPLTTLNRNDVKKNLLETSTYRVIKGKSYDVRMLVFSSLLTQNATLLNKDVWEVPVKSTNFCK
ncbi:hypothetical protein J2I47_21645 [Fibrella sp. HMF5335]|uniref:Lipoprotein n=1 Tax=Fibrella rubiginis TaxID=2817060 RepID=A0A939K572_9BACT|nr:hypothetical protein [Fibrella rubiginis]MBO0939174.1 hypothetical protein [Fibrella rubiginis]